MPLFSEHIANMYYGSSSPYTGSPYSSYSSSVSPIGSSYSASYLNPGGSYSSHSSLGGYSRTPLNTRWITSSGRNYAPMLSTISERASGSPVRISSPRRLPLSSRTYGTPSYTPPPRPVNINTADIDVSRNRYRPKVESQAPEPVQTKDENAENDNGPFMPRIDGKPETGIDSSPGTQRSTIKRGRTVVRLYTIKRKEKDSPRASNASTQDADTSKDATNKENNEESKPDGNEFVTWREKLSDDLTYVDKKEKKTLGAKLVEKFIVKNANETDLEIPSKIQKVEKNVFDNSQSSSSSTQLPDVNPIPNKILDRRCSMELLAEQANLLDSLIMSENLSTGRLDLSKIGVTDEATNNISKINSIKRQKQDDQRNQLKTTKSDHSLHDSLKTYHKDVRDPRTFSKRRSIKKSSSGSSLRRLDSITEFPKEPINIDLPAIQENKLLKEVNLSETQKQSSVGPKPKPKLKAKITSSVEISPPASPLKFKIENVTVEEKPRILKKEIIYSSEVEVPEQNVSVIKLSDKSKENSCIKKSIINIPDEQISPEPETGNFWDKIGKRETVYLMKRRQNIETAKEQNKRAIFWFPEDEEAEIMDNSSSNTEPKNNNIIDETAIFDTQKENFEISQNSMISDVVQPVKENGKSLSVLEKTDVKELEPVKVKELTVKCDEGDKVLKPSNIIQNTNEMVDSKESTENKISQSYLSKTITNDCKTMEKSASLDTVDKNKVNVSSEKKTKSAKSRKEISNEDSVCRNCLKKSKTDQSLPSEELKNKLDVAPVNKDAEKTPNEAVPKEFKDVSKTLHYIDTKIEGSLIENPCEQTPPKILQQSSSASLEESKSNELVTKVPNEENGEINQKEKISTSVNKDNTCKLSLKSDPKISKLKSNANKNSQSAPDIEKLDKNINKTSSIVSNVEKINNKPTANEQVSTRKLTSPKEKISNVKLLQKSPSGSKEKHEIVTKNLNKNDKTENSPSKVSNLSTNEEPSTSSAYINVGEKSLDISEAKRNITGEEAINGSTKSSSVIETKIDERTNTDSEAKSQNIPMQSETKPESAVQNETKTGEEYKAENIIDKDDQPQQSNQGVVPKPALLTTKKPVKEEKALRPLIATPRPLQKKVAQVIHSSDSSDSSSEEESSEEDDDDESDTSEDSAEFYECENNPDGRTSTGSNDSGFDSSAPTSPATFSQIKKDCDVNCHRKCEKLTANLCGVNQRLLVEALATRTASKKGGEAGASSSTPASKTADIVEQELEQSTAYDIFRKTGRFTPPARSIPRFRKYTIEDFQFIKVLGKGSFGKVLLAELRDTEYYYAVKCLKKDVVLEDDDVECTLIERKVLALGTNHPYLCHLFATFQTDSHLFFVMEYLNGGDLMFHIQQSGRFPEARARFYAAEIVSGLKFLHKRGIVYRDLKLDNILLDFEGHVRIADFGMCKLQIYLDKTADTFCGTPDYMAPEIIKGQKYNQTVDWWSFGVLLYEMLIGQSPFSGCDEDELFWSICNEMPSYPRFLSHESLTILTRLLDKDMRTRLGGTECMHGDVRDQDFFHAIHWDRLERRELEAPFRPRVRHPMDTQYFDRAFTGERPRLTAVEPHVLRSMDQEPFRGFSYTNPNTTDR